MSISYGATLANSKAAQFNCCFQQIGNNFYWSKSFIVQSVIGIVIIPVSLCDTVAVIRADG